MRGAVSNLRTAAITYLQEEIAKVNPPNPPAILSLGTALPQHRVSQDQAADWLADSLRDHPTKARWLRSISARSGIDARHFCIPYALVPPAESHFAPHRSPAEAATTSERMELFRSMAPPLAVEAGRQALAQLSDSSGRTLAEQTASISHLILVTCTGFFAPGLDIAISSQLGLSPAVERIQIGFMGCSALFNAWRTAADFVAGAPQARVLIVCVELCSIHLQPSLKRQHLISSTLFGDGAGACIVGRPTEHGRGYIQLVEHLSRVQPGTEGEMTWQVGDHGFALYLSPQIPDHLARAAPPALRTLFPDGQRPAFWAIHPGGKAIVDQLAESFALGAPDIAASLNTLRAVGNLSSATMVFVLAELLEQLGRNPADADSLDGVAMGFGPGLVLEMARLRYLPVPAAIPIGEAELSTTR